MVLFNASEFKIYLWVKIFNIKKINFTIPLKSTQNRFKSISYEWLKYMMNFEYFIESLLSWFFFLLYVVI